MRRMALSLVVGAALLGAEASADLIYRWKDDTGRLHFSNVGAASEGATIVASASTRETAREASPAGAGGAATQVAASEGGESDDPYSSLSEESFSTVASRRSAELRRELNDAQKQLRDIDSRLQSLKATREQAFEQYGQQLGGVTRPEPRLSDEEEELLEEKEKVQKRIDEIRASYTELGKSASKRHGDRPDWLRPLD